LFTPEHFGSARLKESIDIYIIEFLQKGEKWSPAQRLIGIFSQWIICRKCSFFFNVHYWVKQIKFYLKLFLQFKYLFKIITLYIYIKKMTDKWFSVLKIYQIKTKLEFCRLFIWRWINFVIFYDCWFIIYSRIIANHCIVMACIIFLISVCWVDKLSTSFLKRVVSLLLSLTPRITIRKHTHNKARARNY
jgi:hypothetical protein